MIGDKTITENISNILLGDSGISTGAVMYQPLEEHLFLWTIY